MQLKHTPLFVWQFSDYVLQQLFQFRLQAPNERIFLKTPARHAVQSFIGEIRDLQTMQPRNERAEFVQLHSQLVRQFRLVRDILESLSQGVARLLQLASFLPEFPRAPVEMPQAIQNFTADPKAGIDGKRDVP
jgi:hypothetical protein